MQITLNIKIKRDFIGHDCIKKEFAVNDSPVLKLIEIESSTSDRAPYKNARKFAAAYLYYYSIASFRESVNL